MDQRSLWTLLEPIHAVTYFAPEAMSAFGEVGLRGFWRGYFAGRAAPLGAASAGTVIATFYGFEPGFVERAVPDVWGLCSPSEAIAARQRGASASLTRLISSELDETQWQQNSAARSAALLRLACDAAARDLRPLGLANSMIRWPSEPIEQLWHATTILREHRGDGHVMALTVNDLGPCESTVLRAACSGDGIGSIKDVRGWVEADWEIAAERLVERRLVRTHAESNLQGCIEISSELSISATPEGRDLWQEVERLTDHLAAGPLNALEGSTQLLEEILAPLVRALGRTGRIPFPNPIGVPPRSS